MTENRFQDHSTERLSEYVDGHLGAEEVLARLKFLGGDRLLEPGDRIPADGRLLEAVNLRSDESVLTGESMPVDKDAGVLVEEDSPLA